MQRPLARSVLVALALALAGCPTSGTGPGSDGGTGSTVDFVGRSCNVDAECGDLRCDKIRRQCICLSDESCKSPDPEAPVRYCNNYTGLCVLEISGCRSDQECAATEYCDSSIRSCRAKKSFCAPCAADNECGGQADRCLVDERLGQSFCARACHTTADCPRGADCVEKEGSSQCWPAPNPLRPGEEVTCKNFKGCTPDSLRTCATNVDCADLGDQRCDLGRGRCVAIQQVCGFGSACDPRNRICVAECAGDADCGDDLLRCVNRVCEPASSCAEDFQCPLDKVCSLLGEENTGLCVTSCQSDAQCPLGHSCQRGTDNRYRCVEGCTAHSQCPLDQRCNTTSWTCEGPEVGDARTCQATPVCRTCELCAAVEKQCISAKTEFPFCAACTSPTQCPGGTCVLMDDGFSYCARFCGSGQECPQGFGCLSLGGGTQSACVPTDRRCGGKCP